MVNPDDPATGVPVALLRHFPTDWNVAHRLQGRIDRPLLPQSRAELARCALPASWSEARIVTSPLSRALDTATSLARGREVTVDPRLVELSWGEWEGKRGADLLADPKSGYRNVKDWGWWSRPPGGESPQDAWFRVKPALAEIAADGRPTVLVIHRGIIRVILAKAWGWNFDRPEPFAIKTARLAPVSLNEDGSPHTPGALVPLVVRDK